MKNKQMTIEEFQKSVEEKIEMPMNATKINIGVYGEAIAKQYFKNKDYLIIAMGKRLGGRAGCTAYDLLVGKGNDKYAVNVKSATKNSCSITISNIRRLRKIKGFMPAFLFIKNDEIIGFFVEKSI